MGQPQLCCGVLRVIAKHLAITYGLLRRPSLITPFPRKAGRSHLIAPEARRVGLALRVWWEASERLFRKSDVLELAILTTKHTKDTKTSRRRSAQSRVQFLFAALRAALLIGPKGRASTANAD